jgi:indole-3-glycerol phosphate synthase
MYLEKIVADKKEEVHALKTITGFKVIEKSILNQPPTKKFRQALQRPNRHEMGLIAEIKKASPSKGLIRSDFDPVQLAQAYDSAGADCLSVLTDQLHFQGSNAYLQLVRDSVQLPILRKDFTIDPLQIYEARAIGADAVLLIVAILTKQEMKEMISHASDLNLDVLIEVHDRHELEMALELDAFLIGINNRNLRTFATDITITQQLASIIPNDRFIVSESGISKPDDLLYLHSVGARAFLIGEHFMRQHDVSSAVTSLMGPKKI